MIEIQIKGKQSGYDVVEEYIRRYWERHPIDTVVVSLAVSYDGKDYSFRPDVATPDAYGCIEFLNDWWEGEKYLRLYGIKSVCEIELNDGIYMEEK